MSEIWEDQKAYRDVSSSIVRAKNASSDILQSNWRVWLRIVPKTNVLEWHGLDKAKSGEIFDIISNMISETKSEDATAMGGVWYVPVSDTVQHVSADSSYGKITPSLGAGSKMMADLVGGVINKAGEMISKAPIVGGAGKSVSGFGKAVQQFAGDIDGPLVWEGVTVKPFSFKSIVGFNSFQEYQYYKAVETVLTLMTIPKVGNTIDIIREVGKKYDIKLQRADKYALTLMQEPPSKCSIEVFVGYADPLTSTAAMSVYKQANSAVMLKIDEMILSEFGRTFGENNAGIDGWGVPRMVNMSINLLPETVPTVLDGYKSMLASNKYQVGSVPDVVTKPGVSKVNDDTPIVSDIMRDNIDARKADKKKETYQVTGSPWTSEGRIAPESVSATRRSMGFARIERTASKFAKNIARALVFNIFSINSTATAVLYTGARILKNVGPSRVMLSAGKVSGFSGSGVKIPAGIPGLLVRQARSIGVVNVK